VRWTGQIVPLEDEATFHLVIQKRDEGGASAYLRDPLRNLGTQFESDRLWLENGQVELTRNGVASPLLQGRYDTRKSMLTFRIPGAGDVLYEFVRVDPAKQVGFMPRGSNPPPYEYRQPDRTDDGWQTTTLEAAGIDRRPILALLRRLTSESMDSLHSPDIHAVLIARHGKLALEEYFHGFQRETLQDTRSATKSILQALVGAAMLKGVRVTPSSSVYGVMRPEALDSIDPRKRAMTLEHLMTMSSGLDCDDWDPQSQGNEDTMRAQSAQPDWVRFTLDLPMVRVPGERAAYCGGGMNLAGSILSKLAGRPLFELFDEALAEPLQMGLYHLNLTPTGDVFMGGGSLFRPRDFMKLAQLMLDGGIWNGRRIVSAEWARRATSALVTVPGKPPPAQYGYGWWVGEYLTHGRKVRMFVAAGNGGEFVYAVPELDLVVAFFAGNYYSPVQNISTYEYVPRYILPAMK
jgi:CubicO group peptidase (beta-lactamase class C family)